MHAPPLALVALLVLTNAGWSAQLTVSDDSGSPAINGQGSSSTTISAIGDVVSLTVEAGGSIEVNTHSGTISGGGALGASRTSIEGSAGLDSGSSSGSPSSGGGTSEPVDGAAAKVGPTPKLGSAANCVSTPRGTQAGADALSLVADPDKVRVVTGCDSGDAVAAELVRAVQQNDVLVRALATAGYEAPEIVGAQVERGGGLVLLVAE